MMDDATFVAATLHQLSSGMYLIQCRKRCPITAPSVYELEEKANVYCRLIRDASEYLRYEDSVLVRGYAIRFTNKLRLLHNAIEAQRTGF